MSFGAFDKQGAHTPMSEINMTPLVDVMLVLLIVFIITAPLLTHNIRVDLPAADGAVSQEKPDIITLSLNREGRLFWNDAPIGESDLAPRLAVAGNSKPQPELQLRADRDTRYQKIAEIMSAAPDAQQLPELRGIVMEHLQKNALFFSATLPRRIFPPLFNRYDGDANYFGDHVDNAVRTVPGTAEHIRTDVSCTLFLTEPQEYEGGELVIEDSFGQRSIKLPAGDAILYPSSSLHRVQPVT